MSKPVAWHETFRVRSYEVGPGDRLFLRHLCNYLQEAAANHASIMGFSIRELDSLQFTWVLLRLQVEIFRYPSWQEEVHIETWPAGVEGRFAYRDFLLSDGQGNLLARATSSWLMIHLESRRPVPIPEEVIRLHIPERPRALTTPFPRIRPPKEPPQKEQIFPVMFSDIDLNQHVNNTRYLDWALELTPTMRYPSRLYAEFRAEAREGEQVLSRSYPAREKNSTLFTLHQVRGERLLALIMVEN